MHFRKVLVLLLILVSCTSGRDYRVKDGMMRSELVRKPYQEQQQIISTLDPAIKMRLWKDKMSDTMASKRISKDEKDLIKSLIEDVKPDIFIEGTEAFYRFQSNGEEIIKILSNKYGWTEEKLFLYLMTVMTEKELIESGEIQNYLLSPMSEQDLNQSGFLQN